MAQERKAGVRLLVAGADSGRTKELETLLKTKGYDVDLAPAESRLTQALANNRYDLLVIDLDLSSADALDIIRQIRDADAQLPVIVVGERTSAGILLEAEKLGVRDLVLRPFTDVQIETAVAGMLKAGTSATPEAALQEQLQKREVIRVLNRTAEDPDFYNDLLENGVAALEGYRLSQEAKAAIAEGDLTWINRHVGELTQRQLLFIHKHLGEKVW